MDKLRAALDFCIRYQTVLGYSFVSLITAASEYIFSSVVFKCPCNSWNMLYGCVFLIVPAFILFLLGCMVNPKMWRLLTGTCYKNCCCMKNCCSEENSCCCRSWKTCCQYFQTVVLVAGRALVAPLTWIAVALLRASFYECAVSGSERVKNIVCKNKTEDCHKMVVKIPCDETLSKKISDEFLSFQAQSQLIGWALIGIITAIVLLAKCVNQSCSPVRYWQHKFWKVYLKKEHKQFDIKAKEHATSLAERNMKCFFEGTAPKQFQTPSNDNWQKISFPHTFNVKEQHYSRIHKYANSVKKTRGNNDRSNEGDQNLPDSDEENTNESGV
ncbi:CAHM6 protein, partial [Halcyon senegalensis]|nr:CAHM6 protein [Halcyon senegalensis]